MAMTKRQIASLLIDNYMGGNAKNYQKIDPREVYVVIDMARDSMIQEMMNEGKVIDGEFVTSYRNVPVLCDSAISQYYIVLPAPMISTSQYNGVRQISPMKNQKQTFIKIHNGASFVYATLGAGALHGNVGYYLERVATVGGGEVRAYFQNLPAEYRTGPCLLVKMLSSTSSFSENETLPIPAGVEATMYNMCVVFFKERFGIPMDLTDNATPNQ